jgi:CubicO group peptidase (beta-lactamase class C family)
MANRNDGIPNQVDTKFNLGSMNKMFTAVAFLQLVQQGKLDVDDTIIEHLPDYPNQQVAGQVTIHHLLTHTSGLGDLFTKEFFETSKDRFRTLSDHLPLFVDEPLQYNPGSHFSYSNAGFIVLGLIIEEITGQTYYDYVRENIYFPCGMTNTDSYEADKVVPNLAIGYSRSLSNDTQMASNLLFNPAKGSSAGGGYSTVEDMLHFSNCLLEHRLLSPELTKLLFEGKVDIPEREINTKYAYGFGEVVINNHRIVGHGGGAPGICANLDIFLDLQYTAVVLSNSDYDCLQIKTKIRDFVLK